MKKYLVMTLVSLSLLFSGNVFAVTHEHSNSGEAKHATADKQTKTSNETKYVAKTKQTKSKTQHHKSKAKHTKVKSNTCLSCINH